MGRSPGGGHGNPLLYSCLENLMDRGAWRAVVLGSHRVGHDRSYLASSRHEHPKCTECYTSVVFPFFFFLTLIHLKELWGFPDGSVVKNPSANAGDMGLIPGSGRSSGEGNGNPLQYSCLGNPMERRAWWSHRV